MSEALDEEKPTKKELSNSETIDWKKECIKGNLMPGIIMLEEKRINVDDIVDPSSGNTMLHIAANYGYYNVIRALIEIYNADYNKQNNYGFTPLFLIVSNTDSNVFNFQYFTKLNNLNYNLEDTNGLNMLAHSIISNFHYAFLFLMYLGLNKNHNNDKYKNPLIYFAIINNNKFALTYLLLNKNYNINDGYYNNTSVLSDILITNKNISITKFFVKYFTEEISLRSIHTCKKNLLNFPFYNIYNYELLNTLYFFKTKNYFRFFIAILKKFSPKFHQISNQRLLEDNLVNINIGYKYKMINLKYMIYDLVLPRISKGIKIVLFLLYIILLYYFTEKKIFFGLLELNEKKNIFSIIYKIFSFLFLYIWFIVMFNSSDEKRVNNQGGDIESDIVNAIKSGNIINLPYIGEICPACGIRKKLSETHCFRCKGCFKNKFFHSNLFQICITKNNIGRYFIYLLLKINFYFTCLLNCLDKNKTNKTLLAFFYMFRFKTELSNAIWEFAIGFLLFKEIGHFFALILSLTVKTPYQYIYKCHKKVYPNSLKENANNNMIVQSPEINQNIPFKTAIKNIIKNIF
jgi:hypothetical protein